MCGLAGFVAHRGGRGNDTMKAIVSNMADTLERRGPDDRGVWADERFGLALGHRRLAVVDLSATGHQPMVSASGRYVMVFNGEIYNHLVLRDALGELSWRGRSDTETLLAAITVWGLKATLEKVVGMFALALWDSEIGELCLARDRMGEKPLYYGWQGGTFLFGSELKALRRHPEFAGEIDRAAVSLLLRHGYIPAPYSIYKGIRKLMPGTILRLSATANPGTEPEQEPYWSLGAVVAKGRDNPFRGDERDAVAQLEGILSEAIGLQMIADVPLGAFLSGGIDSSTVVALMQAQSSRPVRTFTIGFEEQAYNEAKHAERVARHLGTDHTELYLSPGDLMDVIPRLTSMFDEPFGDSSAIPTFLVSRLARQHVTVALSGDGGDELFCGYTRYPRVVRQWKMANRVPAPWRRTIGCLLEHLSPDTRRGTAITEALRAATDTEFYRVMTSQWQRPSDIVKSSTEPHLPALLEAADVTDGSFERMMFLDSLTYLPDDILTKVDRVAMATSLETRVPLLDHRVVEFAWSLPQDTKIRDGEAKWVLRRVLEKYLPRTLSERPKMGFGVPIDSWLRGPLRDWAEDLLDEQRLTQQGFFQPGVIRTAWQDHLTNRADLRDALWPVLMFQTWLDAEDQPRTC